MPCTAQRRSRLHPLALVASLFLVSFTSAQDLTVYTGAGTAPTSTTSLSPDATYTGLAAYDPTRLTPPSPPESPVTSFSLNVPNTPEAVAAANLQLSIPQKGNFLGFSVELSVANTIMGSSATNLKVPFLNYMSNIQNRAGAGAIVRVGGNSQEGSTIFTDALPDGGVLNKIKVSDNPTETPIINYSVDLFYLMRNITGLVGVDWYFGLSFNESAAEDQTGNVPLAAHWAQEILGANLLGLSVGNEPDLYVDHNKRTAPWGISNYVTEYDQMTQDIISQGSLSNQVAFLGPSTCCDVQGFELDDVFNAGWLNDNVQHLAAVTVQHYPTNNCKINGNIINAQDIFANFLNHTSAQSQVSPYLGNSAQVQSVGKELVMLETNTASCGGFPGLSDSFGAAMWLVDYALQMAWGNFSAALVHVGGQNVYYNPFTPPPSANDATKSWTTGSIYYSSLVVAETFGRSNASKIVDITPPAETDANYIYHPAYAVYEDDAVARVVLFNFIDDSTGANDVSVTVPANGAATVNVRYFRASSVSEQYDITWANQTLGTSFASDGRLYGDEQTIQITCTDGNCVVPVYAPSIAVVFLTEDALSASSPQAEATTSYGTTVVGSGDATVGTGALQTSNGQNVKGDGNGRTSKGNISGASRRIGCWTSGSGSMAAVAVAGAVLLGSSLLM
ncbi:hypothetical protein IAU60_003126 [Kwoniella sp. DSM 27419]